MAFGGYVIIGSELNLAMGMDAFFGFKAIEFCTGFQRIGLHCISVGFTGCM